jgi:hypothetical protein
MLIGNDSDWHQMNNMIISNDYFHSLDLKMLLQASFSSHGNANAFNSL